MKDLFFVSLIIPCRNEEKFVGRCLDSLIANDYPKDKFEILFIDGMSEDGTRKIIENYEREHHFIRILDNPKRVTPCALNIGIKNAKGEVIMIIGSHSTYKEDYISKCVKYLSEYNADNVGGVMVTFPRGDTFIGRAIASVLCSRFGVGSSIFRIGSKEPKWVDTVFGGCYKKEVFEKIGLFNENLVSTQDMEFNLRLKRAGGRTLLVPEVVSYYYTRSDLKSFCKNNFRNGFWAIYPFKFTRVMPVSWRHLVPFAFVSALAVSTVLLFFLSFFSYLFLFICVSYFLTNLYFSNKMALDEKEWRYIFVMPFIFALLHIGYGLGSLLGLLRVVASKQFWENRIKGFLTKDIDAIS